jgi:hypothetical protein
MVYSNKLELMIAATEDYFNLSHYAGNLDIIDSYFKLIQDDVAYVVANCKTPAQVDAELQATVNHYLELISGSILTKTMISNDITSADTTKIASAYLGYIVMALYSNLLAAKIKNQPIINNMIDTDTQVSYGAQTESILKFLKEII